jgi:signal transduction histidine kinase
MVAERTRELVEANDKLRTEAEERELIEEELRQAQKMEAVGQLTGGVAHDFNNLLTVIIGNLESLQRALQIPSPDGDRVARAVENAMRGAQRAASLTQRLLAFSRRQPLDPKPVDVGRLVTGMSELLRRTLGETVRIETVLGGGLWRAKADVAQVAGLSVTHMKTRFRESTGLPVHQYVLRRRVDRAKTFYVEKLGFERLPLGPLGRQFHRTGNEIASGENVYRFALVQRKRRRCYT